MTNRERFLWVLLALTLAWAGASTMVDRTNQEIAELELELISVKGDWHFANKAAQIYGARSMVCESLGAEYLREIPINEMVADMALIQSMIEREVAR